MGGFGEQHAVWPPLSGIRCVASAVQPPPSNSKQIHFTARCGVREQHDEQVSKSMGNFIAWL